MDIKKLLKSQGYNLRERINLYAGTIMGGVAPAIFLRYVWASGIEGDSWQAELFRWGISVVGAVPFTLNSTSAGAITGYFSANSLKRKRFEKERELEETLRNLNKK